MVDEDEQYSESFRRGQRAARVGYLITTNPYYDDEPIRFTAWADGFHSVDTSMISQAQRFKTYEEGKSAAEKGYPASYCPYLVDADAELMDVWLLGYAPHVEEHEAFSQVHNT
jgi:hypothetical protein